MFLFLFTELFARMCGVKNFWGRDVGICRAWLAYDPYIYLTEASKVEVFQFIFFTVFFFIFNPNEL